MQKGKEDTSNLDECAKALHDELDLFVHVYQLCPRSMGWPVARGRLWIMAIPKSSLAGIECESFASDFIDIAFGAAKEIDLDYLLLPEGHPHLVHIREQCRASKSSRLWQDDAELSPTRQGQGQHRNNGETRWPQRHQRWCASRGISWSQVTGPTDAEKEMFPGLGALTPRQIDFLACHGVRYPDMVASVDVSQRVDRVRVTAQCASCLHTRSRSYLLHRCRVACGVEVFQYQGLHYGESHSLLFGMPEKLLSNLAGNAFHVYCCAASLVAGLATVAYARSLRLCSQSLAGVAASPHDEEAEAAEAHDSVLQELFGQWMGFNIVMEKVKQ